MGNIEHTPQGAVASRDPPAVRAPTGLPRRASSEYCTTRAQSGGQVDVAGRIPASQSRITGVPAYRARIWCVNVQSLEVSVSPLRRFGRTCGRSRAPSLILIAPMICEGGMASAITWRSGNLRSAALKLLQYPGSQAGARAQRPPGKRSYQPFHVQGDSRVCFYGDSPSQKKRTTVSSGNGAVCATTARSCMASGCAAPSPPSLRSTDMT